MLYTRFPTHAGMQPNGEESPDDEEEVVFYSSGGINLWKDGVIPYSFQKDFDPGKTFTLLH